MHFKESAGVLSTVCSCMKKKKREREKIDELKSVLLQSYEAYVDCIKKKNPQQTLHHQ